MISEGLSRHDAVHTIGSVLAGHLYHLIKRDVEGPDVNADYYRQLNDLTAENWLKSFGEEPEDEGSSTAGN